MENSGERPRFPPYLPLSPCRWGSGGGLEKALEYYERALRSDPNYAPAYAGLAQSYVLLAGLNAPIDDLISMGESAAREALSLDPSLAEAHSAMALLTFHEWNFPEAEREYKLAVTLGPNYATAHDWYGDGFLVLMGRFEETNQDMKQALALDPVSRIIATQTGAKFSVLSVATTKPIRSSAKYLRWIQNFLRHSSNEGCCFSTSESRRLLRTLKQPGGLTRLPSFGPSRIRLRTCRGQAQAKLAWRELHAQSAKTYVGPWAMAIVHIGLGENDKALVWLEKAYRERSADCIALKVDPLYDPLRSDPRFQDLMRLTGLPQCGYVVLKPGWPQSITLGAAPSSLINRCEPNLQHTGRQPFHMVSQVKGSARCQCDHSLLIESAVCTR